MTTAIIDRCRVGWRRVTLSLALATLVAPVALLAGCGDKAALDGTSWRLTAWSVSSIDPADFTITAVFEDGRMGGTAAVNTYGASYEADGDGSLAIGAVTATEMAGPEPAMQAEATYFELLRRVRAYRLAGEELTLLDGDGNEVLIFAREQG